jgi:hypothetical protein
MQEQGFEYVAYVDPRMVSFSPADEGGLEWGSKEWTEKYGYGVTTQWFSQDAVGPDLVGYESFGGGPEEESDDPNAEVYEGLSESEQTAYDAALWGDPDDQPVIDESLTEDEIQEQFENWEPSGCSAEGDDAVYGSQRSSEFYTTFSEELDELYESMEADPRIVELQQKVADCVSDKGLEYVSEEDYWQQMEPVQTELNEGVTYPGQEVTPEEMEAMSEDELNELYSQPETLTEDTRQRLAELQATEIELAVAAYDCGAGYSQNEDLYEEVRVEYEQSFLDDHADELEDFRATEE